MDINELFTLATRKKFRFASPVGQLSVEDLWDLPLSAPRPNQPNLDDIAIALNEKIVGAGNKTSFVTKKSRLPDHVESQLKIVVHIIEVKQKEAELVEAARETAVKKQRIMELIEKKQDAALADKSIDELAALLNSL